MAVGISSTPPNTTALGQGWTVRKTGGDWRGAALRRIALRALTKPVLNIPFTCLVYHCTGSVSVVSRPWFSYFFFVLLELLPYRKNLPSPQPSLVLPLRTFLTKAVSSLHPLPPPSIAWRNCIVKIQKIFHPLRKKRFECFSKEITSKAFASTHPLQQPAKPGNEGRFYRTDIIRE